MYERSAIVLERYIEKILEFNKQYNLRENYNNYKELIDEVENYQIITTKEGKIIQEFDDTVREIENIQKEQEKLYKANLKLEESRNNLFSDLGEDAHVLENKFQKIETNLDKNNEQLKQMRTEFVRYLSDFAQRQKERNKCEKARRLGEANHIEYIKKATEEFKAIDLKDVTELKRFMSSDKEEQKQEITEIMTKNGKNEKVAFNKDVLNLAISTRMNIAEKEAECYIAIYDKMKRLLAEVENDNLNLDKYKKALRDTSVKLALLNAEKEYIVSFLDYERMTTISGAKAHNKMMEEACKNFELDIVQIDNLYQLILREIANKSTKRAYKELYNKNYLKNIEDKEKNFEKEVNNIKINMGTVINSNYWRIEGIKNIYNVFQNEVSEKFEKDLLELKIDEIENLEDSKEKIKKASSQIYDDETEVEKDAFYDDNKEDEEDNDFYDDDEDDEIEKDDFYYDDELDEEDDEFDDDDEEDEEDDEFDDDDEEDEEDDEFDDDDEEDEEDDEFDDDYEEDEEDDKFDDDDKEDEEDNDFYGDDEDDDDELDEEDDEFDDDYEEDEEDDEFDDDDEEEKSDMINKKEFTNKKERIDKKGKADKKEKTDKKTSKQKNTNRILGKIFKDKNKNYK